MTKTTKLCEKILFDLKKHHRNKQDLFMLCIEERLNQSLVSYSNELQESSTYLAYRSKDNLIRKIGKEK